MSDLKKGDRIRIDKLETEEELSHAKEYNSVDLNDFVGIVPIRKLENNEEIEGICQINDERTGIIHIGFTVKVWDTVSIFNTIMIGSKLVKIKEK